MNDAESSIAAANPVRAANQYTGKVDVAPGATSSSSDRRELSKMRTAASVWETRRLTIPPAWRGRESLLLPEQ